MLISTFLVFKTLKFFLPPERTSECEILPLFDGTPETSPLTKATLLFVFINNEKKAVEYPGSDPE